MAFRRWTAPLETVVWAVLSAAACEPSDIGTEGDRFENDINESGIELDASVLPEFDSAGPNGEDTAFRPSENIEWRTVVATAEDTPDLGESEVRLLVPPADKWVRGVLVFSSIGVGRAEYAHAAWREAVMPMDVGILYVEMPQLEEHAGPWAFPEQSALHLTRVLSLMAKISHHPELEEAPLFFFGHSNGAHWVTKMLPLLAERTAGFIAFNGGLTCDGLYDPEVLSIPGLFHLTEYDPIWLRDSSISIADRGVNSGALWSLFIMPDAGHWDVDPSRVLMVMFMKTVLTRRLPPLEERGASESLKSFPLDDVRLGHLDHHSVFDGEEEFEDSGREVITGAYLLPEGTPLDTPGTLHRLVSSEFADIWLLTERYGMEPVHFQ